MGLNPGSPVNFDVPVSDDRKFCAEVTRERETVHKWSNILLMWLHYYSIIDFLSFFRFRFKRDPMGIPARAPARSKQPEFDQLDKL